MKHSKLCRKPYRTALVFLIAGLGMVGGGFILENRTGNMGFYALVMLGILALITAAAIYGVYRALDKRYQHAMGGEPLLRFTLEGARLRDAVQKNIAEIKAKNKAILFVMLFFCALAALVLPFFFEDGYLFVFIGAGMGIFLALAAFVITKYRVKKLRNGTSEFVLAKGGAIIAGEFHAWDMPGASVTRLEYKTAEKRGDGMGRLEITYQAAAVSGTPAEKVIFPIPEEHADKIPAILDALGH
jgi:hypothetical protein